MNDKTVTAIKSGIETLRRRIGDTFFPKERKRMKDLSGSEFRPEFVLHQLPKSPVAEAYKMLRTNIQSYDKNNKLRTILVTSSGPREGKTTTVSNLAYAFAQTNKKTLIVDSDLRNPSFHRLYGFDNEMGLSNVFLHQKSIEEVVHKDVMIPNLDVMTSGPHLKNPAEIIGSKATVDFINQAKAIYDIIIFDSPPSLAVTDAKLLSFNVDGVILVLQSSKIERQVAMKARDGLAEVNAKIIGAVLNNLDTMRESYYYYYKYYYSYYAKDKKRSKTILEKIRVPRAEIGEGTEEKALQKPETVQRVDAAVKKDLFTPTYFVRDKKDEHSVPTPPEENILTMLSKEEKKDAEGLSPQNKKSSDRNAALGRKPLFFKEKKAPEDKSRISDKEGEGGSGLGKKDIFKDL